MKNHIPLLLPITNIHWDKFNHLIGPASIELGRFDGLLQTIPNPLVLLTPLTTKEAVLSSKIEGTHATLEEVLKFEADPRKENKKYDDIYEIINYRNALNNSIDEIKKLSLSLRVIRNAHNLLLQGVRGENKDRGNFRKLQVFIGKLGANIENATYIPPTAERINDLMSNLEKYIHNDEKDVLVQLAIIHAQFEMVHPFMDGNGRVGRMLIPLFLYFKNAIYYPSFYLSEYLESHREEYYNALSEISKNNAWENWIGFFLQAIIIQAKENTIKAKNIMNLYEKNKKKIAKITKSPFCISILDSLFIMPIFNSSDFIEISKVTKASAFRFLKLLRDNNIVSTIGDKKKNKLYSFDELLSIVN